MVTVRSSPANALTLSSRLHARYLTARALPDVQFIWIGGIPFKAAGADYAKLHRQMKNAPDNVLITDVVPLDQARLYMKSGDLMFMPSTQETFGLAIIEGAACGMPVIVRNIHDYDATFGDLVTRCSEDKFAETIRDLQTFNGAISHGACAIIYPCASDYLPTLIAPPKMA